MSDKAAEPACPVCRDTRVCTWCKGERYREVAGGVRIACASCDGRGRCSSCATGAGADERPAS